MGLENSKNVTDGICYLIGAGPGDIGLITHRGLECLKKAEVIFNDFLASDNLLVYAPLDARIIYVGKSAGSHTMTQQEITEQIITQVQTGKVVVRLKGGDPFVFGRGGEEAIALKKAGLAYEIIPGVTAGVAAAAYAGIPVTHRGVATTVSFVTGHEDPEKTEEQTNWQALARTEGTICIYMGMTRLAGIAEKLIAGGRDENEPVAVVQRGTETRQRTVTGTLADIADIVTENGLSHPAMIIVGKVVELRERISWFEHKPLFGKKVLVTRAREQASRLSEQLKNLGAEVVEIPAIGIMPIRYNVKPVSEDAIKNGLVKIAYMRESNPLLLSMIQEEPLDISFPDFSSLINDCDELSKGVAYLVANKHDWVVFTSVNGVEHTFNRIDEFGLDARVFVGKEVAAIGPATAEALLARGIKADLVPDEYTGEALLEEFSIKFVAGSSVLMFRASNARAMLREELINIGFEVDDILAYKAVKAPLGFESEKILRNGDYDIAAFASSGTVRNFLEMSGNDFKEVLERNTPPVFVSIGPVTTQTMLENGLPVTREAARSTISDLVDAVVAAAKILEE